MKKAVIITIILVIGLGAVAFMHRPDRFAAKGEAIGATQAAVAVFTAMAHSDWNTLRKYSTSADRPKFRAIYGGLQVDSIGKPFRRIVFPSWFVPYDIRLKSGKVEKWNLAVRNDSPNRQWTVDGGI